VTTALWSGRAVRPRTRVRVFWASDIVGALCCLPASTGRVTRDMALVVDVDVGGDVGLGCAQWSYWSTQRIVPAGLWTRTLGRRGQGERRGLLWTSVL